jgi:hypothetical protein
VHNLLTLLLCVYVLCLSPAAVAAVVAVSLCRRPMRLGGGLGGDSRLPKEPRKKIIAEAIARGVAPPTDDRAGRYSIGVREGRPGLFVCLSVGHGMLAGRTGTKHRSTRGSLCCKPGRREREAVAAGAGRQLQAGLRGDSTREGVKRAGLGTDRRCAHAAGGRGVRQQQHRSLSGGRVSWVRERRGIKDVAAACGLFG